MRCERYEPHPISNPLKDLKWLKEKANEMAVLVSQSEIPISVYIYQCMYREKDTGFLIDKGNTGILYNYNGEVVCTINEDTKPLKKDFKNSIQLDSGEKGGGFF